MRSNSGFEFEAPQFIESWENATNIDDGADNFFDALDTLEPYENQHRRRSSFEAETVLSDDNLNFDVIRASSGIIKVQQIADDVENFHTRANNDKDNKERRLSMKRKASPLKDRNVCVPSSLERQQFRKLANKPDALDTQEPYENQHRRRSSFKAETVLSDDNLNFDVIRASSGIIEVQKIADDVENFHALANNDKDNKERRLSMKRKASPLKDRNVCVPSSLERQQFRKLANKPAIRFLPTIAESPVLLTKNRVRPKSTTKKSPQNRLILKPIRKRNIGVCVKPLPKPPTIPEPFNLTEAGKNVHHCYEDPPAKEISHTPVTPGRKRMKTQHKDLSISSSNSETPSKCGPFSFYERDLQLMKRKLERMTTTSEENEQKFQFKAKSPSVLKKEPFRPEVPGRVLEAVGPQLSTAGRARKRAEHGLLCFEKKVTELENNLFVFKAQHRPKANSSFISTASSSRINSFNSSMTSSIGTCASDKSMAFSFYERDKEMLKRKEERMKQVEVPKCEFKAREPTVLSKEPFWPEIESRTITGGVSPGLATTKRAEERKKFELKKKKAAARQKALEEELKKAEEEEIRKLRKTLEFKATSIKK